MKYSVVTAFSLILFWSVPHAAAQDSSEEYPVQEVEPREEQGGKQREVGGHRFVIPYEMDHAFMTSSFAFDQGFGLATVSGAAHARAFALDERLRLQLSAGNQLGLQVSARGTAAVAGDVETLLELPAFAEIEISVGPRVRLLTVEDLGLQVAAGLDFKPTTDISLHPTSALAGGRIFTKETQNLLAPNITMAVGREAFGLQLSVRPEFALKTDPPPANLQFGAAGTIDIRNLTKRSVPIAISVEYSLDREGDTGSIYHGLTPGIFYSGKRDLQLGLRFSTLLGRSDFTLQFGSLTLGYFF